MHPPYGAADGTLYTANLRGAKATDVYTCAGGVAPEEYAPTFTQVRPPLISAHLGTSRVILADARTTLTQHGFRYAEVSGLGAPLAEEQVEALELHTDVRLHGALAFSAPLLNQIQHAVVWGRAPDWSLNFRHSGSRWASDCSTLTISGPASARREVQSDVRPHRLPAARRAQGLDG